LRGHVDSFMAGSGARFSMLPPENAVGNFVKVVQRVPVKILFDEPIDPAMSLGPGMSVVPSVRTSSFTVSPPVLGMGALVLAVLATLGLARVIAHLRD
jgi:membrane fusion protein (multidrug efflux system)